MRVAYNGVRTVVKREEMSAIWPNWCCQQSITVLSTPPSSMSETKNNKAMVSK